MTNFAVCFHSSIGIDLRPHLGQANPIPVPDRIIGEYQWPADKSSVSTEHFYRKFGFILPISKIGWHF
jgi:hypothetical protein